MLHHHDARYPFLFYQTTEEERIIRENRSKFDPAVDFFCWDINAGYRQMISVEGNGGGWAWQQMAGKTITDPALALAHVRTLPEDSMIFMKDFHKYWEKISVIRGTLNLKDDLKNTAKTICFLSAQKIIPPELSNDVTMLDFEYPDEKSLKDILEKVAEDNKEPLSEAPKEIGVLVNAMRGLTWEGAENALALSLAKKDCFDVKTLLCQKAAQLETGGAIDFGWYKETYEDIAGLDVALSYIKKTIGKKKARGVLFYGIPGAGKSLTAKATANYMGWPCLILNFSNLKDKYQGVAESKLREAFKIIRAVGFCVVFMDEIEAIASGISTGGDNGVGQALYKELLKEMEDSRGCGAYWIGTCNDLDPLINESGGAILSRFNSIFFADLPNESEAKDIAKIWSRKEGVKIPEDYSLEGYSGRDISKLAEEMSMQGISAEEASQYILPYGIAHKDKLAAIRDKAKGVCIWASKQDNQRISLPSSRKVRRGD